VKYASGITEMQSLQKLKMEYDRLLTFDRQASKRQYHGKCVVWLPVCRTLSLCVSDVSETLTLWNDHWHHDMWIVVLAKRNILQQKCLNNGIGSVHLEVLA